jgi:hypothetical protein
MKQLFVSLTVLLLMSFLTMGCSTIRLTDYWMDETFKGPTFQKYLVISLASKTGNRIILEDNFVRQIKKTGAAAVASYKILPPDGTVNKELIREAVEGKGFDAVIIGRLVGIDVHKNVNLPDSPVGAGLYGTQTYEWYQPGYDYPTYKIQTSIWQVASEKMVWECEIDVLNPKDILKESKKIADQIVKHLVKINFI